MTYVGVGSSNPRCTTAELVELVVQNRPRRLEAHYFPHETMGGECERRGFSIGLFQARFRSDQTRLNVHITCFIPLYLLSPFLNVAAFNDDIDIDNQQLNVE